MPDPHARSSLSSTPKTNSTRSSQKDDTATPVFHFDTTTRGYSKRES